MSDEKRVTPSGVQDKAPPPKSKGRRANTFRKKPGQGGGLKAALVRVRPYLGVVVGVLVVLLVGAGALPQGVTGVHLMLYACVLAAGASRTAMGPVAPAAVSKLSGDTTDDEPAIPLGTRLSQADLVVLPLAAILLAQQAMYRDGHLIFPLSLFVLAWATNRGEFTTRVALAYVLVGQIATYYARGGWAGDAPLLIAQLAFAGLFAFSSKLLPRIEREVKVRQAAVVKSTSDSVVKTTVTQLGLEETGAVAEQDLRKRLSALETGLKSLLDLARGSTQAHSTVMMTAQGDGAYRVFVASTNETLSTDARSDREGLLAMALKQGGETDAPAVLRIHPLEGRTAHLPYMEKTPARIRSVMSVVVRRLDGTIDGVIFFDRTAGPGFDERDAERAERTATLVARLLETEREVHAVTRQSAQLEHLVDASKVLSEAFSAEDTWESILRAAAQLTPLRFGALLIREGAGDAAHIVEAMGEANDSCRQAHVELGSAFAGHVFKTPTVMPASRRWSAGHLPLLGTAGGPELAEGDAVLVLPLKARGAVLGALVLVGQSEFDDDTLSSLRLLGVQVTEAVLHAQLLRDLERRASTDSLTGLDNRSTVMAKLEQSLARARRSDTEVSVLMLDIDHFKKVNDTYGHPMGDRVLVKVSQALDDCRRLNDSIGRVGGEEFLMVLEDTGEAGARVVADRMMERLRRLSFAHEDGRFGVTASVGLASSPRDAKRGIELIKRADTALYRAKRQGRDRLVSINDPKPSPNVVPLEATG